MEITVILSIIAPFVVVIGYFGYGFYLDTRPDRMRAVLLDAGKNVSGRRVRLNEDGKSFSVGGKTDGKKYSVTEDCVYRVGTFRVPTSYYNKGKSTPINLQKLTAENPISAQDFHIATESNIARQIIEKFDNPTITLTSSMLIVILVVGIANGVVYFQLNTALEEIKAALGIVTNGG